MEKEGGAGEKRKKRITFIKMETSNLNKIFYLNKII